MVKWPYEIKSHMIRTSIQTTVANNIFHFLAIFPEKIKLTNHTKFHLLKQTIKRNYHHKNPKNNNQNNYKTKPSLNFT